MGKEREKRGRKKKVVPFNLSTWNIIRKAAKKSCTIKI